MVNKKFSKSLIKNAKIDTSCKISRGNQKPETDNDSTNPEMIDNADYEINKSSSGSDSDASTDDEDVSDTGTDASENPQEKEAEKSKADIIRESLLEKYKQRQGTQLFLRFPQKMPATDEELQRKVKELSPLIIKAHKPRQKYVNFCLVDFKNKEDRDLAFKSIQKSIKSGQLNKHAVSIPRTESMEFVNKLIERKIQSNERKKAKSLLKKATNKSIQEKKFTSTIVITNLPKTSTIAQIREVFPNAVDIKVKASASQFNSSHKIATITLPSTIEARRSAKQTISLSGVKLQIRFDMQRIKKKKHRKHEKGKYGKNVNQPKLADKNVKYVNEK